MLKQARAQRVEQLAKNLAKDILEYKYHCGVIEGYDVAIALAEEARKKTEA